MWHQAMGRPPRMPSKGLSPRLSIRMRSAAAALGRPTGSGRRVRRRGAVQGLNRGLRCSMPQPKWRVRLNVCACMHVCVHITTLIHASVCVHASVHVPADMHSGECTDACISAAEVADFETGLPEEPEEFEWSTFKTPSVSADSSITSTPIILMSPRR